MRQPDDPEAIAERIRAFREYLERIEPRRPRKPIAPLIQEPPTREQMELIREMRAKHKPGN